MIIPRGCGYLLKEKLKSMINENSLDNIIDSQPVIMDWTSYYDALSINQD